MNAANSTEPWTQSREPQSNNVAFLHPTVGSAAVLSEPYPNNSTSAENYLRCGDPTASSDPLKHPYRYPGALSQATAQAANVAPSSVYGNMHISSFEMEPLPSSAPWVTCAENSGGDNASRPLVPQFMPRMPDSHASEPNISTRTGALGQTATPGLSTTVALKSPTPQQTISSYDVYAPQNGYPQAGANLDGLYRTSNGNGMSILPIAPPLSTVSSNSVLYRKLAVLPTADFGKDKTLCRSTLESLVYRYHRRLTQTSRSLLFAFVFIGFFLTLTLIYFCSTGFGIPIILGSIVISGAGLLFSLWLLTWILQFDEGPVEMHEVAVAIHEGSEAFFHVQYGTITKISLVFASVLFFLYCFRDSSVATSTPNYLDSSINDRHPSVALSSFGLALMTSGTFLFGAFCSALSGYSGMWVSVRTNVRVAAAARRCYNEALQLCFRGGAFSSIINVALAVGGIAASSLILLVFWPGLSYAQLPLLLVGFGFGASLVAMFAQLGGGIYTKAADVGADLVGKVEAGIPEDDPRNPAVIADLVGDNVGDCAGQCADVFESISAEIISAMILGGALAQQALLPSSEAAGYVLFPLGVHSLDIIISSIAVFLVRTKPGLPDADSAPGRAQDPLAVMIRVYFITCFVSALGFGGLCRLFLFSSSQPYAWMYYWGCGVIGMMCAFLFVLITQYYTDYEYAKVKRIAEASKTGPATNIIAGLSVGLESTALPVILIALCVLSAYYLGQATLLVPSEKKMAGLFGTAVATMGMLSTAAFVLTMSSFGPIADNAGGIVEMSRQEDHVRAITDRLDAVGNVTKANTKGFSVGTAALACFLLFAAFLDEITLYSAALVETVDLSIPEVFIGGLLGAALVFLFCAWAMEAVGRAAQQVVEEVRRQFSEFPGIMDFTERPDYHACVAIVSRSALREMIRPGLLAVLSPVAVGIVMRCIGYFRDMPNLAAQAVASFLMFSTATGILTALFLNNSGGAWDNAKKYIETGASGGKGSRSHKAAVVGDTVGDPCKDTAGPSVHVLIKLVSTVTMVLAPIFASSRAA